MAYAIAFIASLLFAGARAHMEISYPLPFRAAANPHSVQSTIDYSMTSPLTGASQFPCKGYNSDMSAPTGAGTPTASWAQGAAVNFTLTGGAPHGGGSCQVALSYDAGKSFNVIHSYIGSCGFAASYDFTIPSDAPVSNTAMFAWVWYNEIGNREIYMNCAAVEITSGSGTTPATAFKSRPDLFVANVANGCTSGAGKEVVFPCPGPDVTNKITVTDNSDNIVGTCAAVNGIGGETTCASTDTGSGSSSSGSSSVASGQVSSATTAATTVSSVVSITILPSSTTIPVGGVFATSASAGSDPSQSATGDICSGSTMYTSSYAATAAASAASPGSTGTSSSSGTIEVTTDGECGPSVSQTCAGSTIYASCCSQFGYCGDTSAHCGTGCQSGYGTCGMNGTSSGSVKARSPLRKKLWSV